MKHIKYLAILSLLFLFSCKDDEVSPASSNVAFQITIQSQEDLDNTDFNQIDTIKGPLTIRNTSITDLSFLRDICVTGLIEIFGNESLTSLNGIERLSCVKSLVIAQNENLRDIQALNNLAISEDLIIRNNGLEKIDPINSIDNISEQIFINEPNLDNYELLENLIEIKSLVLGGSLAENLDALVNLERIESELRITGNQKLTDYCGIKNTLSNSGLIIFETLGNQINPTVIEIVDECE